MLTELTLLQIGSLFLIIILGAVFASRQTVDVAVDNLRRLSNTSEPLDKTQPTPSSYALALYSGLWAFDGWDQANYVGGQMSDPARDLPRVVHIAMPLVITLFLCANVAYFVVLPLEVVAASNTVGLDFGKAVMGHAGSVLFSAVVGVSCFGALNGSFFTCESGNVRRVSLCKSLICPLQSHQPLDSSPQQRGRASCPALSQSFLLGIRPTPHSLSKRRSLCCTSSSEEDFESWSISLRRRRGLFTC